MSAAPWIIGGIDAAGVHLPMWVSGTTGRFVEPADLEAAILHWASSGWPDDHWPVVLAVELSDLYRLSPHAFGLLSERYPPRVPVPAVRTDLFAGGA